MRKLRFSRLLLATLVLLTLAIGSSCGWQFYRHAQQQRAIEKSRGIVNYYFDDGERPLWYSIVSRYVDRRFVPYVGREAVLLLEGRANDADLDFLGELPNVASLVIRDSEINDVTLERMGRWTEVEAIVITNCKNISDAGLGSFSRFPLKYVEVENTPITRTGLFNLDLRQVTRMEIDCHAISGPELQEWPQLTSLAELRINDNPMAPPPEDWRFLRCCNQLRDLRIDVPVNESATDYIVSMSQLSDLALTGVSDRVIQSLGRCERINSLTLAGNFTGETIQSLARCPVQYASLVSESLQDSSLAVLARLPTLTRLKLYSSGLTRRGVEHFRDNPTIETLEIYYAVIADDCIDILLTLPKLRHLRLVETKVTKVGRDRILAAKPNLELDWSPRPPDSGK